MAYEIEIGLIQRTDGKADSDNKTVSIERSDDLVIHLTKTKVFTKHITAALSAATTELCDMGIQMSSGKPGKP